jgi:hypothetical protein
MEQRKSAEPAGEDARPLLMQEGTAKRRFGAVLEQHVPLLVGEFGDELLELSVGGGSEIEGG